VASTISSTSNLPLPPSLSPSLSHTRTYRHKNGDSQLCCSEDAKIFLFQIPGRASHFHQVGVSIDSNHPTYVQAA